MVKGIDIAKEYLGCQEVRDKEKIEELLKEESHDRDLDIDPQFVSWCAAFMNATQRKAGGKGTGSLAALSFKNYGDDVSDWDQAQEGDIVCFVFPDDLPGHGHVTYFVEWNDENNTVSCLGGNQNNSVNISRYSQDYVVAIRRGN